MAEYVQVLTTVDSEEAGVTLARGIVEARLAACVQIVGPNPVGVLVGGQGR